MQSHQRNPKIKLRYRLLELVVIILSIWLWIAILYGLVVVGHELPLHFHGAKIIYQIPSQFWGFALIVTFGLIAPIFGFLGHRLFIYVMARRQNWSRQELLEVLNGKGFPDYWYVQK